MGYPGANQRVTCSPAVVGLVWAVRTGTVYLCVEIVLVLLHSHELEWYRYSALPAVQLRDFLASQPMDSIFSTHKLQFLNP